MNGVVSEDDRGQRRERVMNIEGLHPPAMEREAIRSSILEYSSDSPPINLSSRRGVI